MSAVVLAALGVEASALRRLGTGLPVVQVGAGPRRAQRAGGPAAAAIASASAVAIAGVAGGLDRSLAAGEVVVATELRRDDAPPTAVPVAPLLAAALRDAGLRVRLGPLHTSTRLVAGARARAALARSGAVAVDMESAWLGAMAGGAPIAAVRVVVDRPGRELWHPSTPWSGRRALASLERVGPVLGQWAGAVGPRRILLASPRSFCAGVERAIDIVERALERYGAPVYVRRQIVHNSHVVQGLADKGAVFVEEIDEVPAGATVVLSAHGVAPAVRHQSAERGLRVVDATCPLVAKVHAEARRFAAQGSQVVLIGHAGHDEVTGTLGENPTIRLVETEADARALQLDAEGGVAVLTQTTMASDDVDGVLDTLRNRFPQLVQPAASDICYATQNRQDAVRDIARQCDLVVVVGSANSSNANRLVEVAERAGGQALLVEDVHQLSLTTLASASSLGVTAAASTPERLVTELLDALAGLGGLTMEERIVAEEEVHFNLPAGLR